jgi:hypothetical protein
MLKTLRSEVDALGSILRTLALAAVVGAIYREMRLPPEERTWHGRLLNAVPYDFRIPTPARLIGAWWNPRSDRVIGDPVFGVGWSVNLAALLGRVEAARGNAGSPAKRRGRSRNAAA